MIEIHEISKVGFYPERLGIEMPGRARLHLDREGAYPSHMGVTLPDFLLEVKRLSDILFPLKGDTHGEEDIGEDLMPLQLVKTVLQSLIGIGMSFMNFSQTIGSHIGRKGDEGFWPRKGFLEGLNKLSAGESERLKEAFHLDPLLPDPREQFQKVFRILGRGIETEVEGFISIGERFPDRLEHFLHTSKSDFPSASDRDLGRNISTAPGALNRTPPSYGKVIDG